MEAFGNRIGQSSLFELLFGEQSSTSASFMANDDFASINTQVPEFSQLAKWDNGKWSTGVSSTELYTTAWSSLNLGPDLLRPNGSNARNFYLSIGLSGFPTAVFSQAKRLLNDSPSVTTSCIPKYQNVDFGICKKKIQNIQY